MEECSICGDEFESSQEKYLHMGEEHRDELNSHQKDEVKKAEKKHQQELEDQRKKRKQMLKKVGIYGLILLILAGAVFGITSQMEVNKDTTPEAPESYSFDLEGQPFLGSEDASVSIVEFGDYRCPACKMFEDRVFPRVKRNLVDTGKAKFYFLNYAFLGPGSQQAAIAGECVIKQDKEQFWNFHEAIYANQGPEGKRWVSKSFLMDLARDQTEGIDYQKLEACIANQETAKEVQKDMVEGKNAGVPGTPAVYINGERLESPSYANIKQAVDTASN